MHVNRRQPERIWIRPAARGLLAFERLQLRRRAERLECVRARTRAAVEARRTRQPAPDPLPLDELT